MRWRSMRPPLRGSLPRKMFSATVSSGSSRISWWMSTTPAASASPGFAGAYGSPSMVIDPEPGWWTPVMSELSVDLPAPFSPIRPMTLPCGTAKSMPFNTVTGPKLFVSCVQTRPAVSRFAVTAPP